MTVDVNELLPFIDFTNAQTALPRIAKDERAISIIQEYLASVATSHRFILGDARDLGSIDDESVHLVVTSPPYWTLKEYNKSEGQLGYVEDYATFLDELDRCWRECLRVLVKGGRLIIVVGDVCLSRRRHGRHAVVPLHASIQERCRRIGFDNLAPIIWYKIANARLEVENGSSFLGKPYEPNAVIKNDIEYILMQRKPGGYRKPDLTTRVLSVIGEADHRQWFQQIWTDIKGASTRTHPAPFPVKLAERLIKMFSFTNDVVLDPFSGTGSTAIAAARANRHSLNVEIDQEYLRAAAARASKIGIDLECEPRELLSNIRLPLEDRKSKATRNGAT